MARQPAGGPGGDGVAARHATPTGAADAAPARVLSRAAGRSPQLIVNADDFGGSSAVNHAVIEAHLRGVLTSASLMVTGAAADEAIALAHRHPSLSVGLHLVLIGGMAAAPHARVPHLTRPDGRLPDAPLAAGVRLAFDPRLRREAAREIEAQLALFAATGLPLGHVDGHLNYHLHPVVFPLLAAGAARRGARGIRLPRDDLRLAVRHDRRHLARKLLWAAAFGLLRAWAGRRLPAGMHATDRVFGLFQSGDIQPDYVLDVLRNLRSGSAELYLHPSTAGDAELLGPNPVDLATLLDPTVARALESSSIRLATYASLGAA